MIGNRYIFVDFDGCLLPGKAHIFQNNREAINAFMRGEDAIPYFDPIAVQMHNLWARHGNAKIVFSTSWARSYRGTLQECEAFLKRIMRENGYAGGFAEDCLTPKRRSSAHIHEISEWLCDNLQPEDHFIAVDDADLSGIADGRFYLQGRWIKCDYNNGLTWQNFLDGCEALNIDKASLMHLEYGIIPKSEEEIQRERALIEKFAYNLA
jgi:hypothetical protein